MKKKRIAIFIEIFAHRNRRGPHHFFPTLIHMYQKLANPAFEVFLFVKTDDPEALKLEYGKYLDHDHVVFLKAVNNRFKHEIEKWQLLKEVFSRDIDIFHTLSYSLDNGPTKALQILQRTQRWHGKKLAFMITYLGIPQAYASGFTGMFENDKKYHFIFNTIRFDGIYAWYENFVKWAKSSDQFPHNPLMRCIESRFCDIEKFKPESKERTIIWASALDEIKRPELFIAALKLAFEEQPDSIRKFNWVMYGSGSLEHAVKDQLSSSGLANLVSLHTNVNNLAPILNKTMCFISTQAHENFPALAMNEAMASGNAIIASNVGRTTLFLKDQKNGIMAQSDDARGYADAFLAYVNSDEQWEGFMKESRQLCETVHTPENFIRGLEQFWQDLLDYKK